MGGPAALGTREGFVTRHGGVRVVAQAEAAAATERTAGAFVRVACRGLARIRGAIETDASPRLHVGGGDDGAGPCLTS